MKPTGRLKRSIYSFVMLALFAVKPFALAQSAATSARVRPPEFEVVSIHLVDPHTAEGSSDTFISTFPTNLFTMKRVPLSFLIQFAYKVESQDFIAGMPNWMESQEYDLSAKVEGDQQLTLEQMQPMFQRLLEQRFHFKCHRETRMTQGFELIVAKDGPKLQPSKGDGKPYAQILPNHMDVRHMDTEHIAGVIAHRAGKPVIDKTNLVHTYDFRLSYSPANGSDSSLPDFFTALQEELGLKLESHKVPVNFLIVDHVERTPDEN